MRWLRRFTCSFSNARRFLVVDWCFLQTRLGQCFFRAHGLFFLHHKSRRPVRNSLFQAGGKYLLAGIVCFRINQRRLRLLAGAALIVEFESWFHLRTHEADAPPAVKRSDGEAAEHDLVLQGKAEPIQQSAQPFAFCHSGCAVLTSPYPSVEGLTRGLVRLR